MTMIYDRILNFWLNYPFSPEQRNRLKP